jgi:hypothetical protein
VLQKDRPCLGRKLISDSPEYETAEPRLSADLPVALGGTAFDKVSK